LSPHLIIISSTKNLSPKFPCTPSAKVITGFSKI
jgi:hypothetical protein